MALRPSSRTMNAVKSGSGAAVLRGARGFMLPSPAGGAGTVSGIGSGMISGFGGFCGELVRGSGGVGSGSSGGLIV